MLILEYDADNGASIADGAALALLLELLEEAKDKTVLRVFSTENIFAEARLLIASEQASPKDIIFRSGNQTIEINTYGVILNWPDGFADRSMFISSSILDAVLKRRKREKNA